MNLDTLAILLLVLAAIPCALFLLNLLVYRPLSRNVRSNKARRETRKDPSEPVPFGCEPVSVLIPARNEAVNIRATLEAVLASRDCDFEVIVLDDHSTDRTAAIIRSIADSDSRVRVEPAPPLPKGWCGKQHACHVLARLARNPLLVFMDADVRLAPHALVRMRNFIQQSGVALASGVPRQELGTFLEQLLIPLIHFILLGFLPMHGMRRTRWASMSAGCGQLFIARRDAYAACGGHSMLRDSLHDGIRLPRVFRRAGLRTDLFDATDLASCRMYHTNAETWRGLGKNATEGLAAPGTIWPMTVLLLGGQVLPFALLAFAPMLSTPQFLYTSIAAALSLTPRLVAARRFRQPFASAWLHPFGVLFLLTIQWHAMIRHWLGKPLHWKGRSYDATARIQPMKAT